MRNRISVIITLLLCIGIFFRIKNLNWGSPFYFHPDERNIAYLVSLTPHVSSFFTGTFAYGNFLILVGLFLKETVGFLFGFFANIGSFPQAIFTIRLLSFFSSIGI